MSFCTQAGYMSFSSSGRCSLAAGTKAGRQALAREISPGLPGTDSKAGAPDYLPLYMVACAVAERF